MARNVATGKRLVRGPQRRRSRDRRGLLVGHHRAAQHGVWSQSVQHRRRLAGQQARSFIDRLCAGRQRLVADHCYAMVGYNAASGTPITLFNPWGTAYGQPSIATPVLTASFQFEAAVDSAGTEWPHSVDPRPLGNRPDATASVPPVPLSSGSIANAKAPSVNPDSQIQSIRAIDEFFASWIDPTGGG